MILLDSHGRECEVKASDIKTVSGADKKLIESFVKDSGYRFSDFSGFAALKNAIVISAVCKDNPYGEKMASEVELRLYKNHVDGQFCGFAYVGKYVDGDGNYLFEDFLTNDEFICLSIAENDHYPQMMKLFANAEKFFGFKDKDCHTVFVNDRTVIRNLGKPDPEYAVHCSKELAKYLTVKSCENGVVSFVNSSGKDDRIEVYAGSCIMHDGDVYCDIGDFIDDEFTNREADELAKG